MHAAANGHRSSVSAVARPASATEGVAASTRPPSRTSLRTSTQDRGTPAQAALGELQRLVRILDRHRAVAADTDRDLDLLGDCEAITHAEDRLRAVTALLVSLSTVQRLRSRDAPTAATTADCESAEHGIRAALPVSVNVNGVTVRDRPLRDTEGTSGGAAHVNGRSVGAERELAAATARYIARDLAARQLSEFTSAEGYRLARTLARLGGVEQSVEQLLAQANDMRLHPAPLANAMSHSPR